MLGLKKYWIQIGIRPWPQTISYHLRGTNSHHACVTIIFGCVMLSKCGSTTLISDWYVGAGSEFSRAMSVVLSPFYKDGTIGTLPRSNELTRGTSELVQYFRL
jgi:hypothetical protein